MKSICKHKRIILSGLAAVALLCGAAGVVLSRTARQVPARAETEKTAIDLADYSAFRWEIGHGHEELRDGTVYRYRYVFEGDWHDYYTASPVSAAPDSAWEGWFLSSTETVNRSVVYPRADGFLYELQVFSPYAEYFTVSYAGERTVGEETGAFQAQATLTLADEDAAFVYSPSKEMERRGMTVTIAGNTATVTKRWYIAYAENAFLDADKSVAKQEEAAYKIPNWAFGKFSGVQAPRLRHGDELLFDVGQEEGYFVSLGDTVIGQVQNGQTTLAPDYENGTRDAVTFTLWREGETVAENCPRAKWNYYFNDCMPVGKYTVRFTASPLTVSSHAAWWEESNFFLAGAGGTPYQGLTRSYEFEVYAGSLAVDDSALNGYGKQETAFRIEISAFRFGDYGAFFNEAKNRVNFPEYIGLERALESGTYWGEPAQAAQFFETFPRLSFRVAEGGGAEYLFASADWSGILHGTGIYTVYYRAEMKNYLPAPQGEEGLRHCFKAEIYAAAEETAKVSAEIRDGSGNPVKFCVEGVKKGLALSVESGLSDGARAALDSAGLFAFAAFTLTLKEGEAIFAPEHEFRVGVSLPAALQNRTDVRVATVDESGEVRVRVCAEEDGMLVFTAEELCTLCFVSGIGTLVPEPAQREEANPAFIAGLAVEGAALLGTSGALVWMIVDKKRRSHAEEKDEKKK